MGNKVIATNVFRRKVKPLLKKYKTLADSIFELEEQLINNPFLGIHYGHNIFKIRLTDPSKGKGKSGGFRIITYLIDTASDSITIQLITILNKSEEDSIEKADILRLIEKCGI